MSDDKHPYPLPNDQFRTFPDGAPSPHVGGGSTQGAAIPPFPTTGKQPMPEVDGEPGPSTSD